jgi:hypothetical protein
MSTDLWKEPGVPHKGWKWVDWQDNGELIQGCCGHPFRYGHIIEHPGHPELGQKEVGCCCCDKLTENRIASQTDERLHRLAGKRKRWATLDAWQFSKNGNEYINKKRNHVCIFKKNNRYSYMIKDTNDTTYPTKWGPDNGYATDTEAKLAAFDRLVKEQRIR